jgi:putative transposase
VLRTETHIIKRNHRLFRYCDEVCYKSKNLFNYANYIMRQQFIKEKKIITAFDLNKQLKTEDVFKELPSKTSQQIIINLCNNWKSFFKATKDWSKNREKYLGKPNLPKYKDKNGRNIVFFDYQQGTLKAEKYKFPKTESYIETRVKKEEFKQIKIIPYGSCYKICIVYKKDMDIEPITNNNYLSIDLGVDNLATLTNNIGLQPIVINGKMLKSRNNYYNKKLARLKSYVGNKTSNKIKRLSLKRNNIIETNFHKISRFIVEYCLINNLSKIVIGNNKNWKQKSKLSKFTNQKFVQIPFDKLIKQIQYKAEELGLVVILIEESYTSKASFIDNDQFPSYSKNYKFSGNRTKRGLYKSKDGILINADVNGSYNILRKCNPQFKYNERIKGVSLYPVRINMA